MMIINSYRFGGGAPPAGLLLDDYPNAAAAYSLRQLRTGVTNVVRVRESGGNTEADFTPTQITDGTLAAFCGANDGFVTVWYDQSGNGHNATQAVTASQPQIVNGGSLILENGKPAIRMDGVNDSLDNISYTQIGASALSAFVTIQTPADTTNKFIDFAYNVPATGTGALLLFNRTDANFAFSGFEGRYDATGNYITGARGGTPNANQNLFSTITDGSNTTSWGNSVQLGQIGITTPYDFSIGIYFGKQILTNSFGQMDLQEFVIYNSDQSANRAAIETEINTFYGVY